MDDFYLTLPSNVVSDQYNNTVANFTTKLASRIELSGDWKVGLAAISYTRSWYNVSEYDYLKLHYFNVAFKKEYNVSMKLLIGRYDNIEKLIENLNIQMGLAMNEIKSKYFRTISDLKAELDPNPKHSLALPNLETNIQRKNLNFIKKAYVSLPEHPRFELDEKNRKITCVFGIIDKAFVFPEMSENLSQMLGFDKREIDFIRDFKLNQYEKIVEDDEELTVETDPDKLLISRTHIAQQPFDLTAGYHSLYIYCNLVKPSYIGDAFAQLLRFVEIPTQSKYGDQIVLTYPDTHYIPVMTKEFQNIEIVIKNDIGQLMPFEFGRSIIVLHFRKS